MVDEPATFKPDLRVRQIARQQVLDPGVLVLGADAGGHERLTPGYQPLTEAAERVTR
jgi:hypothetical protein